MALKGKDINCSKCGEFTKYSDCYSDINKDNDIVLVCGKCFNDRTMRITFEKYLEMNWEILKVDLGSGENRSIDFESNKGIIDEFLAFHNIEVEK